MVERGSPPILGRQNLFFGGGGKGGFSVVTLRKKMATKTLRTILESSLTAAGPQGILDIL